MARSVGENHPHTALSFTARQRIGKDGSLLHGSWKGVAVGQLVTRGQYSELITWRYELADDNVIGQVGETSVSIPQAGDRPRIGVVGAGAFAWNVVIPALQSAGADVVAVTDASRLRSSALAAAVRTAVTVDPPSALLQPGLGLDGVVIACAHSAHAAYARRALRSGYDVLVEKPAAMNGEELRSLVEAARLSGRGLYVGHNRRYARGIDDLIAVANDNGPSYLYAGIEGYPLGPLHWYRAPDQGGRILGNLTHWIDLAIGLHGDRLPAAVRAAPLVGEGVGVDLRFPDGSLAEVRLLQVGRRTVNGRETITLVVEGTSIRVDDWRRVVTETGRKRTVQRGRRSRGHANCYRAWVESLIAGERGNERKLAQLIRSHYVAFSVLEQIRCGEETWRALEEAGGELAVPEGVTL